MSVGSTPRTEPNSQRRRAVCALMGISPAEQCRNGSLRSNLRNGLELSAAHSYSSHMRPTVPSASRRPWHTLTFLVVVSHRWQSRGIPRSPLFITHFCFSTRARRYEIPQLGDKDRSEMAFSELGACVPGLLSFFRNRSELGDLIDFSFFRLTHQFHAHSHAYARGGRFSAEIQHTNARHGYRQLYLSREGPVARNLSVVAWV